MRSALRATCTRPSPGGSAAYRPVAADITSRHSTRCYRRRRSAGDDAQRRRSGTQPRSASGDGAAFCRGGACRSSVWVRSLREGAVETDWMYEGCRRGDHLGVRLRCTEGIRNWSPPTERGDVWLARTAAPALSLSAHRDLGRRDRGLSRHGGRARRRACGANILRRGGLSPCSACCHQGELPLGVPF
jgi:hypothetical protein